jgi:parallel beta-helix repeat protein
MWLCSGQAAAAHVSCGDTVTQDTTLDSDLSCATDVGLSIGADDITLDLNGHTIEAESGEGLPIGIYNDDVTIENGRVFGSAYAVVLGGATRTRIQGLGGSGSSEMGLLLVNHADSNLIEKSSFSGYLGGIFLDNSSNNRVDQSSAGADNLGAIWLQHQSDQNEIVRSTAYGSPGAYHGASGIVLYDSADNRAVRNVISTAGASGGVLVLDASGNLVRRNSVSGAPDGISVYRLSRENRIEKNSVFNTSRTESSCRISRISTQLKVTLPTGTATTESMCRTRIQH